jgi:hypothetical protein
LAIRAKRRNAQCVNIRLHQTTKRSIYHPMTLERLGADEALRNYVHTKMPAAISRAGVSCVKVTIIDDFERVGREGLFEAGPDQGDAFCGQDQRSLFASC